MHCYTGSELGGPAVAAGVERRKVALSAAAAKSEGAVVADRPMVPWAWCL